MKPSGPLSTFFLTTCALLLPGALFGQLDLDFDGMSDVWENRIARMQLDPAADADGDGHSNLEESVMGTDPNNVNSGLRAHIERVGDSARISWPTVENKRYRPRLHTNLRAGQWTAPDLYVGGSSGGQVSIVLDKRHITAVEGVLLHQHFRSSAAPWEDLDWNAEPMGVTWIDHAASEVYGFVLYVHQQIQGWLTPPVSGTYRFRLNYNRYTRDYPKNAELRLALDGDPANATVQLSEHDPDVLVGATTTMVELEAGSPVYFILRNRGYNSKVSVDWMPPGARSWAALPSSALSLYLPEPVEAIPEGFTDWSADIEVFDVDTDGDTLTDHEEAMMGSTGIFRFGNLGLLENDRYILGRTSGWYETLHVRILDADNVMSQASKEGQGRRLRVVGRNINATSFYLRHFKPFTLQAKFGGTATLGEDYLLPGPSTLEFTDEEQKVDSFDIILLDDNLPEDNETLEITFDPLPIVDVSYANPVHHILDDDRPSFGLEVEVATAVESPRKAGRIRAFRTGDTSQRLDAFVSVTGTAVEGLDYMNLRKVAFLPGESEIDISVVPFADDDPDEEPKTVILRATPPPGYDLVPHKVEAMVTITERDATEGTLYLATYGPEGAAQTEAWGYATLRLSEDGNSAVVNTRFAGLSSPQTVAHVHEGPAGVSGPVVEGLPYGEVSDHVWTFRPADRAGLLDALENGRLYVNVHSVNYPAGEIRGNFYPLDGSDDFSPPADLPRDAGAPGIGLAEAHRFLLQSTMGPTPADSARVQEIGIAAWLDEQIAMPATSHYDFLLALEKRWRAANPGRDSSWTRGDVMWFTTAVHSPDQLRRRVIHALGQIFVVSRADDALLRVHLGRADYMDTLGENAFGNFRDLLYDVARHPVMGQYLSHLKNQKANPAKGTFPDENFAREVMQLFSIGLFELHPDGSLRLDPATGGPIPTYGSEEISELARVFTGYGFSVRYNSNLPTRENDNFFHSAIAVEAAHRAGQPSWASPMKLFPAYHDAEPKRIIGGIDLVGLDGESELHAVVDSLFLHPNTGPFIAQRLIKRLTTANPSPGYVYRVAQAFADNGQGVRGDMEAVVRAIFLDAEARDMDIAAQPGSGKFREPLLMLTHLLKQFDPEGINLTVGDVAPYGNTSALPADARFRYIIMYKAQYFVQAPQFSPTVFNFFDPDFVASGPLGEARLTSPEASLLADVNLFAMMNKLGGYPTRGVPPIFAGTRFPENTDTPTMLPEVPDISDPQAIVADLNTRLFGGTMSPLLRQQLGVLLATNPEQPYHAAFRLSVFAPEFLVHP